MNFFGVAAVSASLGPGFAAAIVVVLTALAVRNLVKRYMDWRRSIDPNELVGTRGFGKKRAVEIGERLHYTVFFENLAKATAPAQFVRVHTKLDPDLDMSTVQVEGAWVAGVDIPLTTSGTSASGTASIPFGEEGTDVSVGVTLDSQGREFDATFAGPPDLEDRFTPTPYSDFLAPNKSPSQGEGYVRFSVAAKDNLRNGTVVGQKARVTFDEHLSGGSFLDTNLWTNVIDMRPPAKVKIGRLPRATSKSKIKVTWKAQDVAGVAAYEVQLRRGSSPRSRGPWKTLHRSTSTKKSRVGVKARKTYCFRVRATDYLGHQSGWSAKRCTSVRNKKRR